MSQEKLVVRFLKCFSLLMTAKFYLLQLFRHSDELHPQDLFLEPPVYDDDAANKFKLFCIYSSLLSFFSSVLTVVGVKTKQTIAQSHHIILRNSPPISTFLAEKEK